MASRTVMVSLNSKTAIATAVTGSTAPRIATGVLPIFWMAALVHISEKAVGNKAMPKAEGQSIQLLFSVWIQSGSKLNANRNRPNNDPFPNDLASLLLSRNDTVPARFPGLQEDDPVPYKSEQSHCSGYTDT